VKPSRLRVLLVLATTVASTTSGLPAQTGPALADYFTDIAPVVIDASYAPLSINGPHTADLNGDGNEDLVVLGANYPGSVVVNVPQPGRVFLGDGKGHFAPAPTDLFPVDTLMTVHPRKVLFADFNADGVSDMFISSHGWDAPPFPGEQNRLYLSRLEGGWEDATATLPQLSDFSHTSAVGDISGRGLTDIFVGNGYAQSGQPGPYTLLNTGRGQFTRTTANIPVGRNQLLDPTTGHHFLGATFADLDDDGMPELLVTADSSRSTDKLRRSTIFWNRAGVFAGTDWTALPVPDIFQNTHIDHDVQRIDVNQDGLQDLLIVGTQAIPVGQSTSSGWFVQVLINHGNRQFVDETADRVPLGEGSAGSEGVVSAAPWPLWVRVLDFNQDGAPDFTVDFMSSDRTGRLSPDQPVVWINDGTGHFSTLKVGDFVPAGREWLIGNNHLVATPNGYSFISLQYHAVRGTLTLTGLLASKPYRRILSRLGASETLH
jgi:hypothetical protein